MFSLLSARVIARPLLAQRALAPLSGAFGAIATIRSMRTSAVLLEPTKPVTTTKKAANTEKTSTKKATKTATAAKKGTKATAQKKSAKKATTKPKEPKPVKEKKPAKAVPLKLTAADKPPRRPANPYALFIKHDVSRPEVKPKSVQEARNAVKQASLTWGSMTDAEKQPFKDEAAALQAAWQVKYDTWSERVDKTKLNLLNKRRADKGKRRIVRRQTGESLNQILNPYVRFVKERSKKNDFSETPAIDFFRSCAAAWKNLSKAEQKPFLDAYNSEKAEYLKTH